jgi:two-component system, NarL family, nitrate/nitrite response regulator NarL
MDTVSAKLRALIVDDHELVRAGLRFVFEASGRIEVCGEAATAVAALEVAQAQKPDIVLLDLALADGDGCDLIGPLRAAEPPPRVLVMSMHDESVWGRLVVAAGADGFIAKTAAPSTLVAAIDAVCADSLWVEGRAVRRDAPSATPGPVGVELSERELEILDGVAGGLSAKEIAARLGVMPATVDSHKRNIRAKLGIHSMAELIVWAQSLRGRRSRA